MVIIPPRPFLFGAYRYSLVNPIEYIIRSIPVGASYKLMYLLINYPRTFEGGGGDVAQTSRELSYKLYDADGRTFQVDPVSAGMVTSPAGTGALNATTPIGIDYPGGSALKLEITGQVPGGDPDYVSITFMGIRGWEYFGARGRA